MLFSTFESLRTDDFGFVQSILGSVGGVGVCRVEGLRAKLLSKGRMWIKIGIFLQYLIKSSLKCAVFTQKWLIGYGTEDVGVSSQALGATTVYLTQRKERLMPTLLFALLHLPYSATLSGNSCYRFVIYLVITLYSNQIDMRRNLRTYQTPGHKPAMTYKQLRCKLHLRQFLPWPSRQLYPKAILRKAYFIVTREEPDVSCGTSAR